MKKCLWQLFFFINFCLLAILLERGVTITLLKILALFPIFFPFWARDCLFLLCVWIVTVVHDFVDFAFCFLNVKYLFQYILLWILKCFLLLSSYSLCLIPWKRYKHELWVNSWVLSVHANCSSYFPRNVSWHITHRDIWFLVSITNLQKCPCSIEADFNGRFLDILFIYCVIKKKKLNASTICSLWYVVWNI